MNAQLALCLQPAGRVFSFLANLVGPSRVFAKGQNRGGLGRRSRELLGFAVWFSGRMSAAPVESRRAHFHNRANYLCTSHRAKAAKQELYSLLGSPPAGYKQIIAEKNISWTNDV